MPSSFRFQYLTPCLLTIGLLVLFASEARASTPDLETPSMETICDVYEGAAFGVCNAYCEAMDCHLDEPRASERACERKRERFITLTGEAPPCELSCPCMAIDGFADLASGEITANECISPSDDVVRVSSSASSAAWRTSRALASHDRVATAATATMPSTVNARVSRTLNLMAKNVPHSRRRGPCEAGARTR